ncbi:MAG TPA: hypothetical protein VI298_00995 [Geobacteraceae bacterium]
MTEPESGKLVIRGIADANAAERVVTFLCASAKNATPEATAARLQNLPLVLSSSIRRETGQRIARSLVELGADAVFIPETPAATILSSEPQAAPPLPDRSAPLLTTPAAEQPGKAAPPTNRPQRQEPARNVTPPFRSVATNLDADRLHQIAAAQKLLIWGVVAAMAPLISPVLYVLAIPFQLYAVYRTAKVLEFGSGFIALYVVTMFVPLLGIIMLLVLNSSATKALKAAGISVGLVGARKGDLEAAGVSPTGRLAGPIFTGLLLIVGVVGVSSGMLPSVMPSSSESVEARLEREAEIANKKFPQQLDADTRIDSVKAGPGKLFTFNYTLINYAGNAVSEEKLREAMADKVKKEACGSKVLQPFIQKGVSIGYSYVGNDGSPVTTITVSPSDCGA